MTHSRKTGELRSGFGFAELHPYMVRTVSFHWEGNLLSPVPSLILRKLS